jgi:uncharacterized protein (TIGR02145 family)
MNKVISMIAIIVGSLGAAGIWAQYPTDDMKKHTFCAQVRMAFGMTYYGLCKTLWDEGYSLEKMRTIVNNARNKYGKCIESYYSTFVISALKQTADIYCEKGNVYVGFTKQNSLKAYEKAFEAEEKAIQKEQERKAAENAKAFQKELQKQRKADSVEQAKLQKQRKADSIEQARYKPKISETSFIDPRDNKNYNTVTIGSQIWMAENLNYDADGSQCYDNKVANCNKYGRLYNWETANKSCFEGWHLPSNDEWETLVNFVGGDKVAGKKLKTMSGWSFQGKLGNGTDDFGFAALPGGAGTSNGDFMTIGGWGGWWSTSEYDADIACFQGMVEYDESVYFSTFVKNGLLSVRCVKD